MISIDPARIREKRKLIFALATLVLVVSFGLNLVSGSVPIPLDELWEILTGESWDITRWTIIWKIRLPRAVASIIGGAYLATAGLLLQVFFRNPIVGPFILGISSGATLTASLVLLTSLTLGLSSVTPFVTSLAAFAGAFGTMLLILAVASRVRGGTTLLITGLMVGYLCHAVTNVMVAFAEQEKIKGFVLWQMGSFSGFKWAEIELLILFGGMVLLLVYALGKPLNAFLLGEDYAATMGVDIRVFRLLILLAACALAGMVTAVAGPVGFVGLAVPHLARLMLATSDNRLLLPGAMLAGGIVTSICDLAARTIFSPQELPISAVTAFFGAPTVIWLLVKRRSVQ